MSRRLLRAFLPEILVERIIPCSEAPYWNNGVVQLGKPVEARLSVLCLVCMSHVHPLEEQPPSWPSKEYCNLRELSSLW